MGVVSDSAQALASLRAQLAVPLSEELCGIAKLRSSRPRWVETLECLYAPPEGEGDVKRRRGEDGHVHVDERKPPLRRTTIRFADKTKYVAVSYSWTAPPGEDTSVGGYLVESEVPGVFRANHVRDVVLDRVLKFTKHHECHHIWIDQECINQDDEAEKQAAIQSMDLVYSKAEHSIALLSVRIQSARDLELLTGLLRQAYVEESDGSQDFKLKLIPATSHDAEDVLKLLQFIVGDRWWTRAWTFQEDYKAGIKMKLLISHDPELELAKAGAEKEYGNLSGELSIKSTDFRREATRFCLAYQDEHGHDERCKTILKFAAKYNISLREPGPAGLAIFRSMSPTIFQDLGSRGLEEESDRLAIAANCLDYAVRLDTHKLKMENKSLSMSMLALYLLNGEILDNDESKLPRALSDNIFRFLKRQSFDDFQAPIKSELRFIKSCRFPSVSINGEGTRTNGVLWRSDWPMHGEDHVSQGSERSFSRGLSAQNKRILKKFAYDLLNGKHKDTRYPMLAQDILDYLQDTRGSYPMVYQEVMVGELARAIQQQAPVRLACPVTPGRGAAGGSYRGIFVVEADDAEEEEEAERQLYFFTAEGAENTKTGEIATHVSLIVDWINEGDEAEEPHLVIKGWADGLCFPDESSSRTVLFPWPSFMIV